VCTGRERHDGDDTTTDYTYTQHNAQRSPCAESWDVLVIIHAQCHTQLKICSQRVYYSLSYSTGHCSSHNQPCYHVKQSVPLAENEDLRRWLLLEDEAITRAAAGAAGVAEPELLVAQYPRDFNWSRRFNWNPKRFLW
jgi:hypothetical protein